MVLRGPGEIVASNIDRKRCPGELATFWAAEVTFHTIYASSPLHTGSLAWAC